MSRRTTTCGSDNTKVYTADSRGPAYVDYLSALDHNEYLAGFRKKSSLEDHQVTC